MKQPIVAFTVSKNYLEPKKYSVKYLKISTRKDGIRFWSVSYVGMPYESVDERRKFAHVLAEKYGLPYFDNIMHGKHLTIGQKITLRDYGVAV